MSVMSPRERAAAKAQWDAAFNCAGRGSTEAEAVAHARASLERQTAVVTKPGDPGGYRGEYGCSDCCSMTHCETHHKDEGTYPFDEAPVYGGVPDATLDRGPSTTISATELLKQLFLDGAHR